MFCDGESAEAACRPAGLGWALGWAELWAGLGEGRTDNFLISFPPPPPHLQ